MDDLCSECAIATLSEGNIIEIVARAKHPGGSGIHIIYQPTEKVDIVEPLELVLVKCTSLKVPIEALCRVEGTSVESSKDLGEAVEVALREIDDDLNPFGLLLDYV